MALSVAESIGDAAAAVVAALALPGLTVVQRKTPGLRQGEAPPVACVAVTEDRFEPATCDDNAAWYGFYLLLVVLIVKKNAVQAGADTVRDWRQQIRRAVTVLTLPANGGQAIDDCRPVAKATFDAAMLDDSLDYSAVAFRIRTLEPR